MNLFISVTGIAQCPDRNYRSVFLKIVQRKNFQIQQLDFIIDQRLRISDLLIGQLGLKLTDLHTGEVSFTISGQVQVIRQLRVPDILFGNGNLCAEIFEPASHLTDIQLDVELFIFLPELRDCLCCPLRLHTRFLLSPIKDRNGKADGDTRILRRIIVDASQSLIVTDNADR